MDSTVGFPAAGLDAGPSRVICAFSRRSRVHLSISSDVRRSRTRARSSSSSASRGGATRPVFRYSSDTPAYSRVEILRRNEDEAGEAVADVTHHDDLPLESGADLRRVEPGGPEFRARVLPFLPQPVAQRATAASTSRDREGPAKSGGRRDSGDIRRSSRRAPALGTHRPSLRPTARGSPVTIAWSSSDRVIARPSTVATMRSRSTPRTKDEASRTAAEGESNRGILRL